ncbi:hypothetical protein BKA70DRAFT_1291125 [Coprinopsis sp. MPI-PUGE-AT-0042]|nr:hypothetical protein BKA70DRAFT_1291125 [Coprinopsis sp. MPI-PUGE-AT-0042]
MSVGLSSYFLLYAAAKSINEDLAEALDNRWSQMSPFDVLCFFCSSVLSLDGRDVLRVILSLWESTKGTLSCS